jgi:hexosaminidase
MRKKLLVLVATLASLTLSAQEPTASGPLALIPAPVSQTVNAGHFELPSSIVIEAQDQRDLSQTLQDLKTRLSVPTGYSVTVTRQSTPNATIRLVLNKSAETPLGTEGYYLSVTPQAVLIRANQPAGIFYGVQTLLQLLPKEIESRQAVNRHSWSSPCVTVTDYPRFGWRGLMFDVSRHFFTKQEVKDFIDQMVKYKFNLLHMHLTDDEGWRVEIKSLPRLTEVGAWNAKRVGTFGTFADPAPDEKRD